MCAEVLATSLEAAGSACAAKNYPPTELAPDLGRSRVTRPACDKLSTIFCATPWRLNPAAALFA